MLRSGRCAGTNHLSGDALFKATLDAKCLVGGSLLYSPSQGVIRLPGTFVAPWQWGWFLIANAYLTFSVAFGDPIFRWRLIGFGGMGAVTAAAVISGQRVALALVPASFLLMLILTGLIFNLRRLLPIGIIGTIAGLVAWTQFQDLIVQRINNFIGRWNSSPADDMIAHQFDFVWKAVDDKPLGLGIGTATNSTRIFAKAALVETWWPKLLYEIGIVGVIIFLIFVTVLTYLTFKTYRSLKEKNLRIYGACFWVFILFISYQTYYYPLDVDPVSVYYWMLIGIVFQLPTIERQIIDSQINPHNHNIKESNISIKPGQTNRFAPVRGNRNA
jgi:hypothetical protein